MTFVASLTDHLNSISFDNVVYSLVLSDVVAAVVFVAALSWYW